MTMGVRSFAALRRKLNDASRIGEVNDHGIGFRKESILSVTAMPRCPAAEISPASLPKRALPGRSTAAISLAFDDSLSGADNGATHAAADATNDNSQCHESLEKTELAHAIV